MTAPQAVSQQNPSKVAFGKVLAIQIVAYVVLVALALVPGIAYGDSANPAVVPFTIIGSLAMLALLVVFSPFRDGTAGHVIAVIAGLLSVVCATTMTLGRAIFAADATGGKDFSMEDGWIAGVGGLLILLIVILRIRKKRKNKAEKDRELDELLASAGLPQAAAPTEGADVMTLQTEKSMELRKEVRQFVSDNPELAAQLIRGWMRGGDDNE